MSHQPRGASVGPSLGDTVGGKYRLTRLIGQGGMGTVYEAQDLGLGRAVAVKFLQSRVAHDFGLVERFMREAKATAAIAHPRIVDVFDVGWTDDGQIPYFVMELLDGKNLTAELRASGPMSVDRAVGIVMQVLDALEAAHGVGFIHRDLKPENIFIIRHGLEEDVKVLDFGITKAIGGADASLTHTGAVLGTPAYMSPEQARGAREIDHRTDLYASGAILYELITGRPPYEGETYNEIIIKIATTEPPPIQSLRPGVHPSLAGVIHKALIRDPDKRWPTCAAMAQALHEVLDDVHTSTGILTEHDPETSIEITNSTLKPTPTAWEVTAPAASQRPSQKPARSSRPAPVTEETEQSDSDPDERTKAIASRIAIHSPATDRVSPWSSSEMEVVTSSLQIPDDTSSMPLPEAPEPTGMTGSASMYAASSRTQTFAVLALVGLVTGAGTYLIGGWIIDPDSPDPATVLPTLEPPLSLAAPRNADPPSFEPREAIERPAAPLLTPPAAPGAAPEAPPAGPEAVPEAPPAAPACRVRASVSTAGAMVLLDGSRADAEIDLPSACGSTHTLEVAAPGRVPVRLELTARHDGEPRRVQLEELPAPAHERETPRAPGPDRPPRNKRNPRLEPNPYGN